jgi:hypothetical protein
MRALAMKWGSRVVVLAACLLLGWLMAERIALIAGFARATWLEIETARADAADPKLPPPKVIAQTQDRTVRVEASLEETAASVDIVGIKPPPGASLHVAAVYADGGRVSLPRKSLDARWASAETGDTVSQFEVTTPGFFILPKSARSLTIVAAPPPSGDVEVSWRNRTTTAKAEAQPSGVQEIAIDAAPVASGWLLLPPTRIADLELAISTGVNDLAIERVILHATPAQTWAGTELAPAEAVSPIAPRAASKRCSCRRKRRAGLLSSISAPSTAFRLGCASASPALSRSRCSADWPCCASSGLRSCGEPRCSRSRPPGSGSGAGGSPPAGGPDTSPSRSRLSR